MDINKVNVKVDEFKADYIALLIEKENDLAVGMAELGVRVAQEAEAIREKIEENVKLAIKAENEEKFGARIKFIEKYLEEIVEPIVDENIVIEGSTDIINDTVIS